MRKLTPQEKEWILNDAYSSESIDVTIRKLDGINGRRGFNAALKADPEFKRELELAWLESCPYLENDILQIHRKSQGDHKLARVMLDALKSVLAYRNPSRYGSKIDLNVNQTVSIKANLEHANARIQTLIRDVTPALVTESAPIQAKTSAKQGKTKRKNE